MSNTQQREYYRQYMRGYYQKHKDYWKKYYLQKKHSTKRSNRSSYHNRRHYLARIDAAWSQARVKSSPLGRLLRRLGTTSTLDFGPNINDSNRDVTEKRNIALARPFKNLLQEILRIEGFNDICFLARESEWQSGRGLRLQGLAIKDSKRCIMEITTSPFKVFTTEKKEYLSTFLRFFDARYFLCFIKPDLSRYCILEPEPSKIRSVTLSLKTIASMKLTPKIT